MAVYTDIAGEIRYRILEYYLAASAAQMRAANSNHVKTLSLPIASLLFAIPYEEVLTALANIRTVAVPSPYEIATCYASLQPAQAAQIRHIHLSKGFAMPSPTSLSYKSLLRMHKLWRYFPDLELVTLDGAVSVRSTADCARFTVSGRSKLYSMALYAAEANGAYDLIRNPDFAVSSSQEAFQTFSSLQEVNGEMIDRFIATSLAERALVGYELPETQGYKGRERV